MTVPEREHSSIVGGSNASRMIGCPGHHRIVRRMQEQLDAEADRLIDRAQEEYPAGSASLEAAIANAERLRGSLNKSSSYADEGTKLHTVMEYLVDNDVPRELVLSDEGFQSLWDELEIDDERVWDAALPAYNAFCDFLDRIMEEDDCDEVLIRVESRVEMPGLDGAFGTCDVLIRTGKRTVVWDWKFGAGVPVKASYTAGEIEYGNDQLMFYARAAMHTHPDYFDVAADEATEEVHLVICQPRVADEISEFRTSQQALEDFRLDLVDAVQEALDGENPTIAIGAWCKFAPCQAQCPLRVGSVEKAEKLAGQLSSLRLRTAAAKEGDTPVAVVEENAPALTYPEALALMLELGDILEPYITEARKQAHEYMEAGGRIDGYKLIPKRAAHDSWDDDKKADAFLGRQGLSVEERRVVKPITPAKARDVLKAKGLDMKEGSKDRKLLDKYVRKGVSSGTNLAREDNPRAAVSPATAAALANKLKEIGVA